MLTYTFGPADLTDGDIVVALERDGRTFGPGGLTDSWVVAETDYVGGPEQITLVTWVDGTQTYLPTNTQVTIGRDDDPTGIPTFGDSRQATAREAHAYCTDCTICGAGR